MKTLHLLAALLLVTVTAYAADDKAPTKAQLHQIQQEKRKLEADKNQLEQDKATLDAQLKDSVAKQQSVQKNAESAKGRIGELQKQLTEMANVKSQLSAKVTELADKLQEAQQQLAAAHEQQVLMATQYSTLQEGVGQRDQSLQSCETKNMEQYKLGLELLDKYQKKSCFSSMLENEPFFGVAKTRIENEMAATKEQMDKQRIPGQIQAPTSAAQ